MNPEEVTVSKIELNGTKLYVKISWKKLSFDLKLYCTENSWSGELSNDSLKQFSSRSGEDDETYFKNVKNDFCVDNKCFVYEFVEKASETAEFIWKKRFEDGTVLLYGSMTLLKDPETNDSLIDFLIEENRKLLVNVKEHLETNTVLSKELEKCKSDFNQDVNNKIEFEKKIYGKFSALLNRKKYHIQVLEATLKSNELQY